MSDSFHPCGSVTPTAAQAIYSYISPNIKPYAPETTEYGTAYGIPCAEIAGLESELTLTFTNTAGVPFNLTVPSSELNVGPFPGQTETCQTFINAIEGLNLVGGSLLKHYYAIFSVQNQTIGFADNGEPPWWLCTLIVWLMGVSTGVPVAAVGNSTV